MLGGFIITLPRTRPSRRHRGDSVDAEHAKREGGVVRDGVAPRGGAAAAEQKAHVVGLSILSGSHLPLIAEVLEKMRQTGRNSC